MKKNIQEQIEVATDVQRRSVIPVTCEELSIVKKLLCKIWGMTEELQTDIEYIKKIYSKPVKSRKRNGNKEERLAKLKHKLLTSRKTQL